MSRERIQSLNLEARAVAGSVTDCYSQAASRLSLQVESGCQYCRYSVAALSNGKLCWAASTGATYYEVLYSAMMGSLVGASLPGSYSNERIPSAVALFGLGN